MRRGGSGVRGGALEVKGTRSWCAWSVRMAQSPTMHMGTSLGLEGEGEPSRRAVPSGDGQS